MNHCNAFRMYCEVMEEVMGEDKRPPNVASVLTRLNYLRQSISCYVCYSLPEQPHSSQNATCQHYTCKKCVGGKLRLPGGGPKSCFECKDPDRFVYDPHLECLVTAYKNLCDYIVHAEPFGKYLAGTGLLAQSGQFESHQILLSLMLKLPNAPRAPKSALANGIGIHGVKQERQAVKRCEPGCGEDKSDASSDASSSVDQVKKGRRSPVLRRSLLRSGGKIRTRAATKKIGDISRPSMKATRRTML